MSIQGRVGRHAKTGGRHCQNWVQDQETVVALLNAIGAAAGGAEGKLRPRMVAGIASDDLFQAILRFEERHFPGQRSGFVDPGGLMLQQLQRLAKAPVKPVPNPAPAADPAPDDRRAEIQRLRQEVRRTLSSNPPMMLAVEMLLLKMEATPGGYFRNPNIQAYLFGNAQFQPVGTEEYGPKMVHNALPMPSYTRVKTKDDPAVLIFRDAVMIVQPHSMVMMLPPEASAKGSLRDQGERDKLRGRLQILNRG